MLKKINATIMVLVFLASMLAFSVSAGAMGGFSVSPVFSEEHQIPDEQGFFDMTNLTPGEQIEIGIFVNNQRNEEVTVHIELVTPTTTLNGIVDYTANIPERVDETLRHSFVDIANIPDLDADGFLVVPPNQSALVPILIDVPLQGFDGIILGSVSVVEQLTEEQLDTGEMIINRAGFVLAVRMAQNVNPAAPDFALGNIVVEQVNHRPSIVVNVRNIQPRLANGAVASAQIYPRGNNTPILERNDMDVNFAPNSIFPFSMIPLDDDTGFRPQPGHYLARVQIQYDGRTWEFEQEFEILPEEVAGVLEGAVDTGPQAGPIPMWMFIAGGGGLLLLIVIIILIVKLSKSNKRNQQPQQQMTQEEMMHMMQKMQQQRQQQNSDQNRDN